MTSHACMRARPQRSSTCNAFDPAVAPSSEGERGGSTRCTALLSNAVTRSNPVMWDLECGMQWNTSTGQPRNIEKSPRDIGVLLTELKRSFHPPPFPMSAIVHIGYL
ncbi:unnamed protein product [Lota lota]